MLNKNRKPIGYLDVAALKEKWEAGEADPVRTSTHFAHSLRPHGRTTRTECKGVVVHDKVPTVDFDTIHYRYAVDTFG